MPDLTPDSIAARALGTQSNTYFRKDAAEILAPDDLSEGAGDMHTLDADGNPLSADGSRYFRIGKLEVATEWAPYIGAATQGVSGPTKQVSAPYPFSRPSWLGNQPPIQGDLAPGILSAAKIQRPLAPLIVAEPVGIEGFAAAPDTSPFWIRYTRVRKGRHSLPSPWTRVPALEFGQSIRVIFPSQIDAEDDGIGIWLTEPGTSTSTTPGPDKLQRVVDISTYNPGFYDLTGPYRHEKAESGKNETSVPTPTVKPSLRFFPGSRAAKIGTYYGAIEWTDENGESLPGPTSSGAYVPPSLLYLDESDPPQPIAGAGQLVFQRGANPPPTATGWRPLVFFEGAWHVLYDSFRGLGNEKPYPLGNMFIIFTGWSSATDSDFSTNERIFLVQRDRPTENTTGTEAPTEALDEPLVFGVTRFPPGTYYAGVTEFARGRESTLSPLASVTITGNEIPRIIHQDQLNLIPNADNMEVGANGLPLDQTIDTAGLRTPYVEASDPGLVLSTNGAQTGATGSRATRWVGVDKSTTIRYRIKLTARNPLTGLFQGSAQVVFEQRDSAGTVTQTTLGTISAPGDLYLNNTLTTAATSVEARLVVQFSGATKNLEIVTHTTQLYSVKHEGRRKRKKKRDNFTWPIPDSTVSGGGGGGEDEGDPPTDPPGDDGGIVLPPDIPPTYEPIAAGSPALVAWGAPDRPSSSGVLLEAKHDFETAIPARWKSHTSGTGVTLARYATAPLAGTNSLRSVRV